MTSLRLVFNRGSTADGLPPLQSYGCREFAIRLLVRSGPLVGYLRRVCQRSVCIVGPVAREPAASVHHRWLRGFAVAPAD